MLDTADGIFAPGNLNNSGGDNGATDDIGGVHDEWTLDGSCVVNSASERPGQVGIREMPEVRFCDVRLGH